MAVRGTVSFYRVFEKALAARSHGRGTGRSAGRDTAPAKALRRADELVGAGEAARGWRPGR